MKLVMLRVRAVVVVTAVSRMMLIDLKSEEHPADTNLNIYFSRNDTSPDWWEQYDTHPLE